MRIDAAWTTRELLARIDASGDVLVALAAAAAVFERAWYSGVAVTRDDWLSGRGRCAAVRRLARQAGPAWRDETVGRPAYAVVASRSSC